MSKENGKGSKERYIEGIIDGHLAVKPAGTIASLLPWPKRWISCDLLDGLLRIFAKEDDTEPLTSLHLPGSEFCVDAKEPLQFSVTVRHPITELFSFRAENNEDYTMWIDTVRACGASSKSNRRTLSSTTSYSSRSSLISRCSSTENDHGVNYLNGDELEGITRRLQSLEESVYFSEDKMSECSTENEKTRTTLHTIQSEVDNIKQTFDTCIQTMALERREHKFKERVLEGEKSELLENLSALKMQNDKLATELTSEQNMRYKHSLELAQQMCINARQWEMRYLRLSLQYLNLQSYLQHVSSGFVQQAKILSYLESDHLETVKTIAEHTECSGPCVDNAIQNGKTTVFTDELGFRTQFDSNDMLLHYLCQQKLPEHISQKVESTEILTSRWIKYLDKCGDSIKRCKESKELCRTGVPPKLRSRIWRSIITGRCAKIIKSKGSKYYQSLVQSPEISASEKQITLDLHRSFPKNVYFSSDNGTKVPVLQRVLTAFSLHNKAIGYCQGMNMIAGMLIFHLDEEMAFWGLVAILEMIMPSGYYNTDLLAARADQIIFQQLVESKLPYLAAYLKNYDIDLSLFSFNWFMTIFIDSLPMNSVIRLWDLFLLEGHKTLLRFSLALVKLHEYSLMQHHDSVSIFNMFRQTARCFYDSKLIIKLAYTEFHPFTKRNELQKQHSEKLSALRAEHAENERLWRERQKLHDTVDSEQWDIVPQQNISPDPPSQCIIHVSCNGHFLWAVHTETSPGLRLLKVDVEKGKVAVQSGVIDHKITCSVFTSGYVLLGTSNGYVLSYNSTTLTKLWTTWVMDCVLGIVVYGGQVLAHLSNGSLVKFQGISETGLYSPSILDIGTSPIRSGVVVFGSKESRATSSPDRVTPGAGSHDEFWCSSGNTLHFIDLTVWTVIDKLSISSHTGTQINDIVEYSRDIMYVSVHTTISVWNVRKKTCLASHDCASVFLPPPSPKSNKFTCSRMTVSMLYFHKPSRTFWVGTSHGHVLIYDINEAPVAKPKPAAKKPKPKGEKLKRTGSILDRFNFSSSSSSSGVAEKLKEIVDDDASVTVLSDDHANIAEEVRSVDLVTPDTIVSRDSTRECRSNEEEEGGVDLLPQSGDDENSITVLSESESSLPLPVSPRDRRPRCRRRPSVEKRHSPSMDSSLVMVKEFTPRRGSNGVLSSSPLQSVTANGYKETERRQRKDTFNDYEVMENNSCDIIESPTDNDISPVHTYQTLTRFNSNENLDDIEKEGEFEVIMEDTYAAANKNSNLLSLNTYQILSSDPIAKICSVKIGEEEFVMTCAGAPSQEGVIVLWKGTDEKDKIRWQAKPVTLNMNGEDYDNAKTDADI